MDKARTMLAEASIMLEVGLTAAAGRTAYFAAFHAAQAAISEALQRSGRTHRGVQAEFHRLIADDATFPDDLRPFLSQAYNLKAVADYGTGAEAEVSAERAGAALGTARRFVGHVERMLAQG